MIAGVRLASLLVWSAGLAVAAGACAGSSSAPAGLMGSGGTSGGQDAGISDSRPSGSGGSTGAGTGGALAGTGGRGTGGAVGTGGAATGGATGSGGASSPSCTVALTPVSAPSFEEVEFGPDAKLRIKGSVTNTGRLPPVWTWTVFFVPTATLIVPVKIDDATIEFPINAAGRYQIDARADTGSATCRQTAFVTPKVPCPRCFRFRVTPAAPLDLGIPTQELRVDVSSLAAAQMSLSDGNTLSVAPQDPTGRFLSAYVRVSGVSAGLTVEGHTARGPVNVLLLPGAVYDVLIVPDGSFAPLLVSTMTTLANPLNLDQGTQVTGRTVDGSGVPVIDARIALRAGSRPSTLGLSDGTGRFSVLTRPGTLSAVIAPPPSSGLPEAHVAADAGGSGIVLDAAAGTLDLSMSWNTFTRGSMSVVVKTTDGGGPAAGARVRVESQAEIPAVGRLQAQPSGGAAVMLTASGAVRLDVDVDDAGLARFPDLPIGPYKVTVVPPALSVGAALTTTSVSLSAAGFAGTLPLARPVMLTGTLLPAGGTSGVHVVARDLGSGVVAPVQTAVAGDRGAYSLSVAPGRRYQLVADPPLGSGLARTVLGPPIDVGAGDTAAPGFTVAPAVSFTSTATGSNGAVAIAGAVVQVFCVASSAGCLDATLPLAEAVTGPDGKFTVALPAAAP